MQTLVWKRSGLRDAKLYVASSGDTSDERKNIPESAKPLYSIQMGFKAMVLYSGDATMKERDANDPQTRPLIDVDPEGLFNTRSTYYDSESLTRRSVQMYRATKAPGVEPDKFLSWKRTFDDFDDVKYKWKTSLLDHHECIRLSDGLTIATFKRAHFSFKTLGVFTLHQAIQDKTLHLLLATCGMCYELQRRRRHSNSGGGGGGGDGG